MTWIVKNICDPSLFHHLTGVHHTQLITDPGDDPQVVGDKNVGGLEIVFQIFNQVQNSRFNGNVQCRCGLIHDQQRRVIEHRHGNDHPLLLPAGNLMGITVHDIIRIRHMNPLEHLDGSLPGLVLGNRLMAGQHFRQLFAEPHRGVQRLHGVLKNHGDSIAAQFFEFSLRSADEFRPLKLDAARLNFAVGA